MSEEKGEKESLGVKPMICQINISVDENGKPTMRVMGDCAEKIEERLHFEEDVWLPSLKNKEYEWEPESYEREIATSQKVIKQLKEMKKILESVKQFPSKIEEELEM